MSTAVECFYGMPRDQWDQIAHTHGWDMRMCEHERGLAKPWSDTCRKAATVLNGQTLLCWTHAPKDQSWPEVELVPRRYVLTEAGREALMEEVAHAT